MTSGTKNGQPLTDRPANAILPDNTVTESAEMQAIGLLLGRLSKLEANRRRAIIQQLVGIEEFLGIDSNACKKCGKPLLCASCRTPARNI